MLNDALEAVHQLCTSNVQVTPRPHLHLSCLLIRLTQIPKDPLPKLLSERRPSLRHNLNEQQNGIDSVPVRLISVLVPRYRQESAAEKVDGDQEGVREQLGRCLRGKLHRVRGLACSIKAAMVRRSVLRLLMTLVRQVGLGRSKVVQQDVARLYQGDEPQVKHRLGRAGLLTMSMMLSAREGEEEQADCGVELFEFARVFRAVSRDVEVAVQGHDAA